MISPVLRAGGRLLGAFFGALAQQDWESGLPPQALILPVGPPGQGRPPTENGTHPYYGREAPPLDIHAEDEDAEPPSPKVIPGCFNHERDEDGYQRGNWRREAFATVIVASAPAQGGDTSDGEECPPAGDPDADGEAASGSEDNAPCLVEEAEAAVSGDTGGPAEGEPAGTGAPDLPGTGAEHDAVDGDGNAPAAPPVVPVTARPVRRLPAPPSTGRCGSWDSDREPWFTGRWGTGIR